MRDRSTCTTSGERTPRAEISAPSVHVRGAGHDGAATLTAQDTLGVAASAWGTDDGRTVAARDTMIEGDQETIAGALANGQAARAASAQMWVRIAAAIEREASAGPLGEDRDLALDWAEQIRRRLRPRAVR
jgi:hypothetical protein